MLKSLFKFRKDKNSNQGKGGYKPYDGPVSLLIENACVITCDAHFTIHDDGIVAVADGRIVAVLEASAAHVPALRERADKVVDAADRIVMPGLINTHCHAGDSLFRGLVEGLALEPWLEKLWIAESAILNAETIRLGSELGYAENLLNGVTTVMDMFWQPEQLVSAAEKVGIRVATGGIFFDPPGIDGANADQREGLARDFFTAYKDHPSLIPSISAHAPYTVSPDSLKTALSVRDDFDTLITIHAAETRFEQKTVTQQYGKRVIHHLDEMGLLSEKTVLAHCVHVDDSEIEVLAKTGATVSHNPASNLKLGSGIAPVFEMLEKGVCVAIGTDGAVSGNDLNIWNAIRLAATLHNGATENPLAVNAKDAILMATIKGAEGLGIEEEVGSLEVGKRADFILINPQQIHGVPVFDPINYLSYAASNMDVEDVYVAGKKLVDQRQLLSIDRGALLEEVNALRPAIQNTLIDKSDGAGSAG